MSLPNALKYKTISSPQPVKRVSIGYDLEGHFKCHMALLFSWAAVNKNSINAVRAVDCAACYILCKSRL